VVARPSRLLNGKAGGDGRLWLRIVAERHSLLRQTRHGFVR
jgi:hypothetical protein